MTNKRSNPASQTPPLRDILRAALSVKPPKHGKIKGSRKRLKKRKK